MAERIYSMPAFFGELSAGAGHLANRLSTRRDPAAPDWRRFGIMLVELSELKRIATGSG
jgi:hypothetical protein